MASLLLDVLDPTETIESQMIQRERRAAIVQHIRALVTPREASVVLALSGLVDDDDDLPETPEALATRLGIAGATIRRLYDSARRRLATDPTLRDELRQLATKDTARVTGRVHPLHRAE